MCERGGGERESTREIETETAGRKPGPRLGPKMARMRWVALRCGIMRSDPIKSSRMPGSAYIEIGLVFPRRRFLRSDFVVVRFHLDGPLARARMSVAGRGYV